MKNHFVILGEAVIIITSLLYTLTRLVQFSEFVICIRHIIGTSSQYHHTSPKMHGSELHWSTNINVVLIKEPLIALLSMQSTEVRTIYPFSKSDKYPSLKEADEKLEKRKYSDWLL